MPTINTVHVNVPLSNFARQFKFPPIVADQVFPIVTVKNEADVYYQFNKEELVNTEQERAPGTEANEISWDVTTAAYKCAEYALRHLLPTRVEENADSAVRPRINTTSKLTKMIQLGWEVRVKDIVTNAAIITQTSVPGTKWDAASGATPEKDVDFAKTTVINSCGVVPNTLLVNYATAQALKRWLKINSYTEYKDFLAIGKLPPSLWELDVIVASAVYNQNNPGQAESLTTIWPDSAVIFYREMSPSLDSISLGYTLRSRGFRVKDWYIDERDGVMFEASVIQDEVLVAAQAAYLYTDVLT